MRAIRVTNSVLKVTQKSWPPLRGEVAGIPVCRAFHPVVCRQDSFLRPTPHVGFRDPINSFHHWVGFSCYSSRPPVALDENERSAARSWPTFQVVTRLEKRTGVGKVPFLEYRHTVAAEQAHRAMTTGSLTCASSGSAEKFVSASMFADRSCSNGAMLLAKAMAIGCNLLGI